MTLRCVDTSAWHRASVPAVAGAWLAALDADEVGMSDQVRLEVLYSARSAPDYDELAEELGALTHIPTTAATFSGHWRCSSGSPTSAGSTTAASRSLTW